MIDDYWTTVNRVLVGAGAYITDEQGRAMLVKPNYKPYWGFPGGVVDEGEHPAQACARELVEEIGLTLAVGQLLTLHWVGAMADRPYPLVHFYFDCGTIPADTPIVLQEDELDDYGFFTHEECARLLPAWAADRVPAAAAARESGSTVYLPLFAG